MTTTLDQEFTRATDPDFLRRVRAAVFRAVPDVMHEPVGAFTATAHQKRHAWAVFALSNPSEAVERAALLLAGENAIRAVDLPAMPADTVIFGRLQALVSDLAGVAVTD